MLRRSYTLVAVALTALLCGSAAAQHPIQWGGNAQAAIARAKEEQRPLMFWITDHADIGDDDDLRDAQEAAFRDPVVVDLAESRYISVRVSRNSRVLSELEKFGLPTEFGLYIALVTPDGKLLEKIDPGQVASPEALAERLVAGSRRYCDDLYGRALKPVIAGSEAPKKDIRRAVQTVWRLKILSADADIVALLDREDVTPTERGRLYELLASFGTRAAVEALLSRSASGDRAAAAALARASAAALEFLLPELPGDGPDAPTARQLSAYAAVVKIARAGAGRTESFWSTAKPEERSRVLESIRNRAESVLEYWQQGDGRWR